MQIFLLILFGFVSGILGGMGMGGGTALIPLLTIFLSFSQKISQGYNLISFLIMTIFALIIHAKNKLINFKLVLPLSVSGIAFSILGSMLANNIDGQILKKLFGVFLILLAIFQFVMFIRKKRRHKKMATKSMQKID